MAIVAIFVLSISIFAVNVQSLKSDCKKQLAAFHQCTKTVAIWKEQEERTNATDVLFKECYKKKQLLEVT